MSKGNNTCSIILPSRCSAWNFASYKDSTCNYPELGSYVKNEKGFGICNSDGLVEIGKGDDLNSIHTFCEKIVGVGNIIDNNNKFNKDFNVRSIQIPSNIEQYVNNNNTEYITLQTNKVERQNKKLDEIQKEIASKDAVLDIYNNSNSKKHKTVRVLIIFFIFLVIFFCALMAHAFRQINYFSLILVIITLAISYIYYLVWTFNYDKIPELANKDFKKVNKEIKKDIKTVDKDFKDIGKEIKKDYNVFSDSVDSALLNVDSSNDNSNNNRNNNHITNPNHNIKEFNKYQELRRREFIEDNCECPDVPSITTEEEGAGGGITRTATVRTNKGKFYYDHSAPKERIYPPVTKEDSRFKENIQWEGGRELGDETSNNINWIGSEDDSNVNDVRDFADPNWKLKNDDSLTTNTNSDEDITWTVDL